MELVQNRDVVVCVGTGGVGKTTVAASIAVAAAAAGRKTLVMTIDPARRLAQAMGLSRVGNIEHRLDPARLATLGVTLRAPLYVMMPDVKRTFDDMIERLTQDPKQREQIFKNRIYQQFSTVLAGSLEYAAVERLYQVHRSRRYDLIILDTPPSQSAVDFLQAPGKILDFFDTDRSMQWLLKPYVLAGKISLRLMDLGGSLLVKTLGRLAGGETLRELADFLVSFQGMYEGLREQSQHVQDLLRSDHVAFTLITSTAAAQVRAIETFHAQLQAANLDVRALVVNRVRRRPGYATHFEQTLAEVTSLLPTTEDRAPVVAALKEELALAERDARAAETLQALLPRVPQICLPELPADAHDLEALTTLHGCFDTPRAKAVNGP